MKINLQVSHKIITFATEKVKNPKKTTMSNNTTRTKEEVFRQKAETYLVCQSASCPLRDHCLRSILSGYVAEERVAVTSINLNNPQMQTDSCPQFRDSQPIRLPVGLCRLYRDMPGRFEVAIKRHLIHIYTRKRYYEYRKGLYPITPDVESTIRQTFQKFGWNEEPQFDGYADEYLW